MEKMRALSKFLSNVFLPSTSCHSSFPPPIRGLICILISCRSRIGEELFFFDASPAYLQGLVALFAFVLGSLLLLDFVLGDTNLVKVFTGRERRSLVMEALTSISVSEVPYFFLPSPLFSVTCNLLFLQIMEKAVEVYEAVEKFENRDYTHLPR